MGFLGITAITAFTTCTYQSHPCRRGYDWALGMLVVFLHIITCNGPDDQGLLNLPDHQAAKLN